MKCLIVFVCIAMATCAPVLEDSKKIACEDLLSGEMCDDFRADNYDSVTDDVEETRERRQLPPGGDGGFPPDGGVLPPSGGSGVDQVLVEAVKHKLGWLLNSGLLRGVPFVGQLIEDLIRRDPEGVANALKDHFFGALKLFGMLTGGGLGR